MFAYDYYYYWAAGKVVLAGGNPYDLHAIRPYLLEAGWPNDEGMVGLPYPPHIFWLLAIFALLPFDTARLMMVDCALVLCCIRALNHSNALIAYHYLPET